VDLQQLEISELAVRLVPERLARRHLVVPIRLDNRTLTYGTFQPFNGEADRDLSFAAGRQAISVFATRASVLASLDEVLEASTGRQAIDIAQRERPDLLLIDLNMPEMDGYHAIVQVRRELTLATMPIVVLTSEDGPGVERRVLDLGADDYIIKPFDVEVLLSRVDAVFRRRSTVAA
jgi:CheY-like chemotaxis protein